MRSLSLFVDTPARRSRPGAGDRSFVLARSWDEGRHAPAALDGWLLGVVGMEVLSVLMAVGALCTGTGPGWVF